MSSSVRLYGLKPARLLCPWGSPGKNTGVGCHALLQGILPTQGPNPCFLLWHVGSLPLESSWKAWRLLIQVHIKKKNLKKFLRAPFIKVPESHSRTYVHFIGIYWVLFWEPGTPFHMLFKSIFIYLCSCARHTGSLIFLAAFGILVAVWRVF